MPEFKEKYRVGKDVIFFIPTSAKLRSLSENNFHCDLEFTPSHGSFPSMSLLFPGTHKRKL